LKQSAAEEVVVADESVQEVKNDEQKTVDEAAEPESTFRTINTGMSIGDYFASKMAELKKREKGFEDKINLANNSNK
jgi:hypothetical protein